MGPEAFRSRQPPGCKWRRGARRRNGTTSGGSSVQTAENRAATEPEPRRPAQLARPVALQPHSKDFADWPHSNDFADWPHSKDLEDWQHSNDLEDWQHSNDFEDWQHSNDFEDWPHSNDLADWPHSKDFADWPHSNGAGVCPSNGKRGALWSILEPQAVNENTDADGSTHPLEPIRRAALNLVMPHMPPTASICRPTLLTESLATKA